ncbi:tRNA (adenosine(37)-N6)-threonylcarbamoyltransferase complex dimerization subunit type 1 TsaB [Hymenobacter taeanensis]|uniref:tRNA (Adenosine(37)-N6)-threonylcarbamoyltransferase complex dimerization subunit type 1 TsaB n=1 Tax=Hymenobacter taeanensis TaxID=2735321 RepID=A0A6M6BG18_9BACT|nr:MULTISPECIES: tRNA (adenosine(37)-N6)-threonylcarbamoyltransferase complex dimerization subunit type 1 TsaB [Hymenobacter]QJX47226.1 tRNA (adenosine(37)-N6)-threonylcarbamoyltransferase complex dimerization subunit type 1 TsaB [Hymenobacter taeanensis]UOQ81145.1 tRNA (adenosine(37)-N6)-threonylcarbamoyltransferase complex dimerization subunit type 1 TsaB [Hymenobacter sp. 5414T-23]
MSTLLLSLETSSPVCSVALHRVADGSLVGQSELRLEKSHSSHLSVLISQLLENSGHTLQDLAAVALSDGPGSYTGLRIGAAAGKGLCYALDIPLLAVSTLQSLAHQVAAGTAWPEQFLYCPMLDARRMEVYGAVYTHTGEEVLAPTPLLLDADTLAEQMAHHRLLFFGSGAAKFQTLLPTTAQAGFLAEVVPSAVAVGALGVEAYQRQGFRDVAYYEPFYLKEVYTTTPKAK